MKAHRIASRLHAQYPGARAEAKGEAGHFLRLQYRQARSEGWPSTYWRTGHFSPDPQNGICWQQEKRAVEIAREVPSVKAGTVFCAGSPFIAVAVFL